ncbi:ankyrin repeat domain-containing protein [Wolbachia endosymbiont (group B) of Camptogramma bilineatum]|uniref:ankyrin repeat domain-containing protein n=1 Tax=Wolbachia endosymbiont (group B) of Camptogramma bilineatum TaxID=2953991 RepID=UPI00222F9FD3|nr:ankyrin repeat domain-containing protein [Wolbachia endosymbiont (group B) of Camptogramma bilineatum]
MKQIEQRELYKNLSNASREPNSEEFIRLIKDNKVDVNAKYDCGETLLHVAAKNYNWTKTAKILIAEGADVNIVDFFEQTPLHVAAKYNHINIAKILIAEGADVNMVDFCKQTPLHVAVENNSIETVRALIKRGANIYVEDELNRMPLHHAVKNSSAELVKAMIEEGVDINRVNGSRMTPSFYISEYLGAETCKTILSHIARLEVAGLYVDSRNLEEKDKRISASRERDNDYSQQLQNCRKEVKKIGKESQKLHSFLKESDINELISMWERNADIKNQIDNHDNLKKQYPEYAHILINKANEVNKVKKEIFLHNHRPLIDVLSENYKEDFQKMSFAGIKNSLMSHNNDYSYIQQETGVTLINCLDFEDVKERHVPKLKVRVFAEMIKNKGVNSNLHHPHTEQTQGASQSLN